MQLNLLRRIAALLGRDRLDDQLADEIRLHIDLRRQALIDDGMDPRDADYEARRMFGNVMAIRERTRDMWGFPSVETVLQDVSYGARLLRRAPMFTAVSVLSLAIGIGASSAVFSLADTVLLRKLPVRNPDELIVLRWTSGPVFVFEDLNGNGSQSETENSSTSFSLATYEKLRTEGAKHADIFAFADLYRVNLSAGGRAEIGQAQIVSANYFDVLGIRPAAGRSMVASDDRPGAPPIAIISDTYWQRRFGRSRDAMGTPIVVNGSTFTIAGVTPRGFRGTLQVSDMPDVTLPLAMRSRVVRNESDPANPSYWWVLMMGRLKPGVSVAQAQPSLDLLMKQAVLAGRPSLKPSELPRLAVLPGAQGQLEEREGMREPLKTMAVVVCIVLLVACANVANLLLARGRARRREIAVRVAIGAPRARVVRQLLTEGVLLAGIGCGVGLLLAGWIAAAMVPALGVTLDIEINWRTDAFTALVASACSILFGLAPSLRATDVTLATGLAEGTRGAVGLRQRFGLSGILVVAQVALSMLLVIAAGLLVYSVRNLQRVDTGFDPSNTLLFKMDPTLNGYEEQRARDFYGAAVERLSGIPGVRAASFSSHTLIANSSSISVAALPGTPVPTPGSAEASRFFELNRAWRLTIDDQFLNTMGIRLLRGRTFAAADSTRAQLVAIINLALGRQLFGDADPLGRQFKLGLAAASPTFEVIGVSVDAKYTSIRRPAPPTVYLSYRQQPVSQMTFALKTTGNPSDIADAAREAIRQLDPNLPLSDFRSQDEQISTSLRRERLFATLASLLGLVTVLLSGIGLYALLAYSVMRRTREIGVRMALGAEQSAVRWMVMRQSLVLVGLGLSLGVPAALAGTEIITTMLYGLTPRDPMTITAAALVMLTVSLAAAYIPARRASRVDPLVALRAE